METKHGTLYLVTFASSRGKNVTSEKKVTAFEMCIYTVFLYVNGFFFSHVETKHGKFCSFNVTSISFCATGNYQVDSNENSTSVNNAHSIKSFLYFIFCLLSKSFLVFLSLGIIVCFSTSYCHKFLQCGMNKSLKSHKKFFPHCFI